MSTSITTSIRLTPQMRHQLDQASHELHRGKNWIINHALELYLKKLKSQLLVDEARRQSILASRKIKEDDAWEENSDKTGWES